MPGRHEGRCQDVFVCWSLAGAIAGIVCMHTTNCRALSLSPPAAGGSRKKQKQDAGSHLLYYVAGRERESDCW
jgi:hypothetical protein